MRSTGLKPDWATGYPPCCCEWLCDSPPQTAVAENGTGFICPRFCNGLPSTGGFFCRTGRWSLAQLRSAGQQGLGPARMLHKPGCLSCTWSLPQGSWTSYMLAQGSLMQAPEGPRCLLGVGLEVTHSHSPCTPLVTQVEDRPDSK